MGSNTLPHRRKTGLQLAVFSFGMLLITASARGNADTG
jgi:hypothetical protein